MSQDIDTAIERVFERLESAEDFVRQVGRPALDHLLDVLFADAQIDLETRSVTLEFRLPKWAIDAPHRVCREYSNVHIAKPEAQRINGSKDGFLLRRIKVVWIENSYVGYAA